MTREGTGDRGFSLQETLVSSAILGLMAVVAMGSMGRILDQSSTQALRTAIQGLISEAGGRAVMERTYVAVAFDNTPRGAIGRLYADGDGDGVTREDIRRGTDRALGGAVVLREGRAFLGVPERVRTDPFGRPLDGQDPIRFGRGDILSVSPTFTSTPGTLYLRAATNNEAWAFRVAGIDGRIRVYRWWKGKWSEAK